MNPISTANLYQSALLGIETNQTSVANLAEQENSQKVAETLSGYGSQASSLTAMNSVNARLTSYVANGQALSGKLSVQDTALSQVATAAQSARTAVAEAIGNQSGDALIATLQSQLSSAAGALNTQYNGQYLFSGGQSTPPATTSSLSSLATPAAAAAALQNGDTKAVSRLDDNTVVQTGVLASDVASPLFNALQAVQAYNAGPNGPLTGTLTSAQSDFLSGVLSQFDTAISTANTAVADNGVVAQQVTTATTQFTDQQTAIQGVVGGITQVDGAKVASQLTLAQTALQASAQVFSSLQNDSLLNLLSSSTAG